MRLPALLSLVLGLCLAGCGSIVYRMDIQQGNIVAPEAFVRLKPGMTKTEVRNVVGTPLLTDIFHANRWDYYFTYEQRGRLVEHNRFSVYFENEKVVRIEGGPTPSAARTENAGTAASPAPAAAPAEAPASEGAGTPAPAKAP